MKIRAFLDSLNSLQIFSKAFLKERTYPNPFKKVFPQSSNIKNLDLGHGV